MGKKKRQVDHSVRADEDSSDSIEDNQTKTAAVNCPHANKAIHLPGVKKALKSDTLHLECTDCAKGKTNNNVGENDNEMYSLLICLKCGHYGCGNGNKHAEQHSVNRKSDVHDLALNLTSWVVWCFKCDLEIPSSSSKKLLECYEFVRKFIMTSRGEGKSAAIDKDSEVQPSPSFVETRTRKSSNSMVFPPSFESLQLPNYSFLDSLPRARGLANLGNTCFFNAVLQCLAQTPFLIPLLKEMREGEDFRLPGGEVQVGEEKENLEPLEGKLKGWGNLTQVLVDTLTEISSGKSEVYYPRKLLDLLHVSCPQFAGYGQHDSHELLRQLLEMVRTEDLQRYKQAILESLNLDKKSERENITEEMRRKVKAYGRQANDLLLRPEHVFRGCLVSTLECMDCHHRSDHIENFLDLSLPLMADKPVHIRPKSSFDEGGDLVPSVPSKHQLKMKRRAATKSRKSRHRHHQQYNAGGDAAAGEENVKNSSDSDNQDQSDADVEDNVEMEPEISQNQDIIESGYSSEKPFNGDSTCGSPASETNVHINRDSAIASPITNDNLIVNNPNDQVLDLTIPESSLSKDNVLISSPGSQVSMACQPSPFSSSSETNLECRLSPADQENDAPMKLERPTSRFDYNAEGAESVSDPFAVKNINSLSSNGNIQTDSSRCMDDINELQLQNSENDKMTNVENGYRKAVFQLPERMKNVYDFYDKEGLENAEDCSSPDASTVERNRGDFAGDCNPRPCSSKLGGKESIGCNRIATQNSPNDNGNVQTDNGHCIDDVNEIQLQNSENDKLTSLGNEFGKGVFDLAETEKNIYNFYDKQDFKMMSEDFSPEGGATIQRNCGECSNECALPLSASKLAAKEATECSKVTSKNLNFPNSNNGNVPTDNTRSNVETKSSTLTQTVENDKMARLENGFCKIFLELPDKKKNISSFYDEDDEDGEEFSRSPDGTMVQRNCGESSGECTLSVSLSKFTAKELMTGNNKVGCEACTKRFHHGKEGKMILTNTSKQLLISSPPAVLILHLKRFQVLRCTFKKKCREVKFPMVLDLAPYCSAKCKNGSAVKKNQNEVLYSLYGVVEHMGTFHRGHYVAYVKVRPSLKPDDPRWSFLPKNGANEVVEEAKECDLDNSLQNGAVGGTLVPPPGKWYYISDSCTSEVKEENVLRSQAYLLFYERIW